MSGTILSSRPRQRKPLAPHGPGERVINGRLSYSAAWLGAAPFEPEPVGIGPEPALGDDQPKEEKMEVTVRFTLAGRGDEATTAEWIARLIAQLLREEGLIVGERGVGVRASRPRTAHADVHEEG
jgi:hypothetical protein